jgi:hypothetical protein
MTLSNVDSGGFVGYEPQGFAFGFVPGSALHDDLGIEQGVDIVDSPVGQGRTGIRAG